MLALVGVGFVAIIFGVGILLALNKWTITNPATQLLIALLFGLMIATCALSFCIYFVAKTTLDTVDSPRQLRERNKSLARMCKAILGMATAGIVLTFVSLLLQQVEFTYYKIRAPTSIYL
jgi:uncharacterized membrane protein